MEWQVIVALVVTIPIILLPVALVWFLNVGGIFTAIKEARARRVTNKTGAGELVKVVRQK